MKVAATTIPCNYARLLRLWAILTAALLLFSAQPASSAGQSVKYLPGYDGELPFNLQTGYISVDDVELFYYFIESQGNPLEDPVMLWLTGGPGCSAFSGLAYEIGPIEFDIHNYTGDLPKLRYYPYTWTKGMVLGSPGTDSIIDENAKVEFVYRMALISDEIYENAKEACNGSYSNAAPNNTACHLAMEEVTRCIRDLSRGNILEPRCRVATPSQTPSEAIHAEGRSLQAQAQAQEDDEDDDGTLDFLLSPPRIPDLWCRAFNEVLSYMWANDVAVQEALHVRPGTVAYWLRCNLSLSYTQDIPSVVPVHEELIAEGLQVLVASGDRDLVVTFVGTITWIKALNLSVSENWRPWFLDGQLQGYTEKYEDNAYYLTYVTVKGAGHPTPEFSRSQCYHLFNRWIHYYPV